MASRLGRRVALADHLALAARHPAGVRDRAFRLRDAHVHGDDIHGKLADEAGADCNGDRPPPVPRSRPERARQCRARAELRPPAGELQRLGLCLRLLDRRARDVS